ncbi:MAG: TetR/AcrR family transcriptional regulator [Vicingaceae bacterium]
MKNIKEKILNKSKELFNKYGVANVSIREIARELGISHSNLIYHFKDKNVVLIALHKEILESAISLNIGTDCKISSLESLFISTLDGFKVLLEYRFFMIDFNHILRENKELHQHIIEIELLRYSMYEERINKMISEGLIRESKYYNEYFDLIKQIRVFSDYWLSSAQIYEEDLTLSRKKYARLLLLMFYPYLTKIGVNNFEKLLVENGL